MITPQEKEKQRSVKLGEGSYRHELSVYIEENRTFGNRAGDIVITATNRYGSTTERLRVIQRGKGRDR